MIEATEELARILSAKIAVHHSMLVFDLIIDTETGGTVGFGGFELDQYNGTKRHREGTAHGCELIRRFMAELDIHDLEHAKNRIVWAIGEGRGLSFRPRGIRALNLDQGTKPKSPGLLFADLYPMKQERAQS